MGDDAEQGSGGSGQRAGKRRGGQPGNVNAMRHGFYSRRFRSMEVGDLETVMGDGLNGEIALMRVLIRRMFDFASGSELTSLEDWSHLLNTLGAAQTRLAGMLRTQKLLVGEESSDVLSALSEALGAVRKEFGRES